MAHGCTTSSAASGVCPTGAGSRHGAFPTEGRVRKGDDGRIPTRFVGAIEGNSDFAGGDDEGREGQEQKPEPKAKHESIIPRGEPR